jgi:hypothetical protein
VIVGSATVAGPLAAGNHQVVNFSFDYPAGVGNVVVVVDPGNSISEFTKENNRATSYVTNNLPTQ